MKLTLILVSSWSRRQSIHRSGHLLTHAVLNVGLGLFRRVKTWARSRLHFEWVDVWLDSSGELWTFLSKFRIFVFAWAWVFD